MAKAKAQVPNLITRLTTALIQMGYTQDEANDMISNEGTASIADFIQTELEFANKQGLTTTDDTAKVILTTTEDKDMAIKTTVDSKGRITNVETIDTGLGIQAAKPLPEVAKAVKPTKVEPTVQKQAKPTASETAELMYEFSSLPVALQKQIEEVTIYGMPLTLPVCHVVGFTGEGGDYRPILKVMSGQLQLNAYNYLLLTDARNWQNLPMLVIFPTDEDNLRKARAYYSRPDHKASQAVFTLTCCSVVRTLCTIDFSQHTVVVPPPASEPKVAAKVAAKATKAKAADKAEAPAKAEAKAVVTEDLLQELATATNHMKKVALVNKVHVALGLAKVDSKSTKATLQPVIDELLKKFSVAAPEPAAKAQAPAKAKATKEPAPKALTKGEIEKLWTDAHIRETGVDAKVAKKAFAALDINWRSSVERAQFVADQGLV